MKFILMIFSPRHLEKSSCLILNLSQITYGYFWEDMYIRLAQFWIHLAVKNKGALGKNKMGVKISGYIGFSQLLNFTGISIPRIQNFKCTNHMLQCTKFIPTKIHAHENIETVTIHENSFHKFKWFPSMKYMDDYIDWTI